MNLLLWLAACIAVLSGTHAVGNDVVVLDKSSFDGFINSHDLVLGTCRAGREKVATTR